MRHPFGVSHRAGKMEYIFSGYLPEEKESSTGTALSLEIGVRTG